jgi:simple sugar transport system ATP-binding protein
MHCFDAKDARYCIAKQHGATSVPQKVNAGMALLELKNISKHFGAIHALNDVSLALEAGEVVGLMGDNGAGKSTLVKIVAGNFRPSHGEIKMEGRELVMHRPIEARQHGIEIVHQDLALCDNLSAAANVFLGRELRKGVGPFKVLDYPSMYRRAGEIFAELRSETRPRDLVRQMSGGQRQAVAIARTRIADARIILMDEPTAAISVRQVAEVLNLIRLLRDRGIAIVLISHRMPDVFSIADRVVVLRRGRKVADKVVASSSPEEVTGLITGAIEHAL